MSAVVLSAYPFSGTINQVFLELFDVTLPIDFSDILIGSEKPKTLPSFLKNSFGNVERTLIEVLAFFL